MRSNFLPVFRLALLLLLTQFFFSCEKDEIINQEDIQNLYPIKKNRVVTNRDQNVSIDIVNFLKSKTQNSLAVNLDKKHISLSDGTISESTNNSMGIVSIDKEIVVINERNTKHTFNVIIPNTADAKINLIVVESEQYIYEYFLKYNFNQNAESDLFSGTIDSFDSDGNIVGTGTVENGIITSVSGRLHPDCTNQDVPPPNPNDDNVTTNSGTGGGDGTIPTPNDGDGDNTSSTSNSNGGGDLVDPDRPCAMGYYYACNRGYTDQHQPRGNPQCSGNDQTGDNLIITDCNGQATTETDTDDPCEGIAGVILDEDEICALSDEDFNAYYSFRSPFTVDMNDVRNDCDGITTVENEKFMCVYNKLIKSPTFKNIFTNVFGETSNNFNVKFKLVDNLTHNGSAVNGLAVRENYTTDSNGQITSMNVTIKLNSDMFNDGKTPIEIAKTIVHECIHAYLYIKIINCSQATSLTNMSVTLFEDLMNSYFPSNTCNQPQNQHEFMADFMLPTIKDILEDIKDDIIPQNQQQFIENTDYYNYSQSTNGPLTASTPFNWNDLYYYLSLIGVHNTSYYSTAVASDPVKLFLHQRYRNSISQLSKNCYE